MDISTIAGISTFVVTLFNATKEINPLYQRYKSTVNVYNEIYEDQLRKCINDIPEESIMRPRESIIFPAMERSLYYLSEKEIREMFAKLIASSFDSRKTDFLHPGFVEIITQLSPNDARVLSYINNHKNFIGLTCIKDDEEFPIIDSKIILDIGIKQTAISMINLNRLGLLNINSYFFNANIVFFEDDSNDKNDPLDNVDLDLKKFISELGYDIKVNDVLLTQLGKAFLEVCID